MMLRVLRFVLPLFLTLISSLLSAQVMSIPSSGYGEYSGGPVGLGLISPEQMVNNLYGMSANTHNLSAGENTVSSVSKLDLKAPSKARREYEKGYQLLLRKDCQEALLHLLKSTELYTDFPAAHNALGSAYLNLGQNDQARQEFSKAVSLDDHLPNSHLNLGVAQLP
jgi:tetratricopeptide (TPR) repeat protein